MGLQERERFLLINIKSNGFKSNASLRQTGLRFPQSHNIIRDRVFNWNTKSMSELTDDLQLSVIYRSQAWMWGPDTITGLWRSREVSNANRPVGLLNPVRCNAKHCLYYRSSTARFPLNPVYCSYVEQANEPALLTCKWLGYPAALIQDLIGLTLMKWEAEASGVACITGLKYNSSFIWSNEIQPKAKTKSQALVTSDPSNGTWWMFIRSFLHASDIHPG